jgi:predicted anti-sigma-YlaC factor YlaD
MEEYFSALRTMKTTLRGSRYHQAYNISVSVNIASKLLGENVAYTRNSLAVMLLFHNGFNEVSTLQSQK